MQRLGHLDWSRATDLQYRQARHRHGTGTACRYGAVGPSGRWATPVRVYGDGEGGKSDRQCRLLVQATNLDSCYLSPPAAGAPICDTSRQEEMRGAIPSVSSSCRTASHCIASHRTAPRGQERAWQGEVRSRTTAAAGRRGHVRATKRVGRASTRVIQQSSNHPSCCHRPTCGQPREPSTPDQNPALVLPLCHCSPASPRAHQPGPPVEGWAGLSQAAPIPKFSCPSAICHLPSCCCRAVWQPGSLAAWQPGSCC